MSSYIQRLHGKRALFEQQCHEQSVWDLEKTTMRIDEEERRKNAR